VVKAGNIADGKSMAAITIEDWKGKARTEVKNMSIVTNAGIGADTDIVRKAKKKGHTAIATNIGTGIITSAMRKDQKEAHSVDMNISMGITMAIEDIKYNSY
jgi:hypothetical protein